ncbi:MULTISPECIES: 5-bromo-4-chloroindolyl phosphate hydrolysis family protein [Vagococcus]|uniref:5-bromo-4-chloroindolyl phosphate hydrolysis protein n=1 Tax=Vagococcus fluvialis bH819 TaxID=1255619 RepID=A0A1X6WS24_9ENTE|nr:MULTISPECIES: 5-bromo-4-chloroindolyl phosphate hydrolysis family protein [Vagococcus]SLM87153.1 5-bromo-4-chloroindolyl phosphate hydrolysis protein [Vagococcus fluvialis bH819]HCM90034.1 5-bromo-4-chloroindolyl phosphate hydrolysis protein [Vagococcus sp.]
MKTKSKSLWKSILLIIVLIPIGLMASDGTGTISSLISIALLAALIWAIFNLFRRLFSKNKNNFDDSMPNLSREKEDHYASLGMTNKEIIFFRDTMADTKKQIKTLEDNMNQVAKLKAINLRYDTLKACKAMFKEIVKEPRKLHLSDRFLYNHLPNLVELTNKYVEINNHELKNKDTFDALTQSATAIEEVSQLIVKDYSDFVNDDLEDLDVEISIAKQNIDREKTFDSYKQEEEL